MNSAYEYYAAQVGGLTESELDEINSFLDENILTEEDVDALYLEVSGQEHEQNI